MRPVLRLARALTLGLLLAVCLPTSASLGRDGMRAAVIMLTPPPGIAVPIGQALEVRCHVLGEAAGLELWDDDTPIFTVPIAQSQEMSYAWTPLEVGPHCLIALALDKRGEPLAEVARVVVGLPPDEAVRLSAAAEGTPIETVFPDGLQCITRGGVP